MSGKPTHPRWTDAAFAPMKGGPSGTYSGDVQGPVRRAELRDLDGDLMGHVWTDGKQAAGFSKSDADTATDAGTYVWRVQARAFKEGRPASDVLNPELYAPLYNLGASKEAQPEAPAKQASDAFGAAAGWKKR